MYTAWHIPLLSEDRKGFWCNDRLRELTNEHINSCTSNAMIKTTINILRFMSFRTTYKSLSPSPPSFSCIFYYVLYSCRGKISSITVIVRLSEYLFLEIVSLDLNILIFHVSSCMILFRLHGDHINKKKISGWIVVWWWWFEWMPNSEQTDEQNNSKT